MEDYTRIGTKVPMVVDLGSHRRGRVRRLEQGRGRLIRKIGEEVRRLQASGLIEGEIQPVVVIVRQRQSRAKQWKKVGKLLRRL